MNPNLFVWTSDWHLGRMSSQYALAAAQHIAGLQPAGVIDTGDCKDLHDGTDTGAQLDAYVSNVRDVIPWAVANGGAAKPILPGNHDDRFADITLPTDFSLYDQRLGGPPYHWTCDWAAPKIRFIGFHARMAKPGEEPTYPYPSFFIVDPAERAWLAARLAEVTTDWTAIVCSHCPLHPVFDSGIGMGQWAPTILAAYGGPEIRSIIANSGKVVAYLNGHRHANMVTATLDGIMHFNGPGVSYALSNEYGGFVPIDYDPTARTLTFRYLLARAPFAPYAGYTPVVIQLPPLSGCTPPEEPTLYTFDGETVLAGAGPLAGSRVTYAGTVEA